MSEEKKLEPKKSAAKSAKVKPETKELGENELAAIKTLSGKVHQRERTAYYARKREVIKFEQTNTKYLVFVRNSQGWWIMGGRSALFFYYDIAEKIGMKEVNLRQDRDFGKPEEKFASGIISIAKLDPLVSNLKQIGFSEGESKTDGVRYLLLPKPYTKLEAEEFSDREKIEKLKILADVVPSSPIPKLHSKIMSLNNAIYNKARNTKTAEYDLVSPILKNALLMEELYIAMANGRLEKSEYKAQTLDLIAAIKSRLLVLINLDNLNWHVKFFAFSSKLLMDIEDILNTHKELKNCGN